MSLGDPLQPVHGPSWVPVPEGSDFTLANLPIGVAEDRAHVAIGDHAVDLVAASAAGLLEGFEPGIFQGPLNRFMASGPEHWRALRSQLLRLLTGPAHPFQSHPGVLVERAELSMELPVEIGDYVDGYAGLHHATNLGRILRPGGEPLNRNWRHLPVMYHGRSGTVAVSGTPVQRPVGQVLVEDQPVLQPTAQLDIELELGVLVGVGNPRGEPVPVEAAPAHIFGYVLVNDWSARDIQAFEYQPLGPFLGKSFLTSISPWVVMADALTPYLVEGLAAHQDPVPLPYLEGDPRVPDLSFEVDVNGQVVSTVGLAGALYWTPAQLLAHLTVNGASTRPGDLIATGTISGPDHERQAGSLIERYWRSRFLADGDTVVLRGWAGSGDRRVGFGPLEGTVTPSRTLRGAPG